MVRKVRLLPAGQKFVDAARAGRVGASRYHPAHGHGGCPEGDPDAISGLAEGLLMSGLAMQAHQSSSPASGAGNNFSQQCEMEATDWASPQLVMPRRLPTC